MRLITSSVMVSQIKTYFFLIIRRPPSSPLFPYTALSRSPAIHELRPVGTEEAGRVDGRLAATDGVEPGITDWHGAPLAHRDRKSTRLNSSHANISYAVFCLKKKKTQLRPLCTIGIVWLGN